MKAKLVYLFLISLFVVTGCSNGGTEHIKEDNLQEKIEDLEEQDQLEDTSSNVEMNLDNSETLFVPIENVLIDDYLDGADIIIDTYLSLGEKAKFNYGADKTGEWELSLDSYVMGNDDFGSKRKALVLNFTHSNIKRPTSQIEGYFDFMEPNVVYDGMKLGLQDSTETVMIINENPSAYENGNRIGYGDYVTGVYNCKRVGFVKEGETESCYTYYSYAGPGEYLISFEDVRGKKVNYKIIVE